MSAGTAALSLMRTSWRTASFCSRGSWSFLIQVLASFGSSRQPPTVAVVPSRRTKETTTRLPPRSIEHLLGWPDFNESPGRGKEESGGPAGLAAALRLRLHGKVEVLIPGHGGRVHHLLQDLEVDVLVRLD